MTESQALQTQHNGRRRMRISLTWVLVLLTVPAAVAVYLYGMAAVMGHGRLHR